MDISIGCRSCPGKSLLFLQIKSDFAGKIYLVLRVNLTISIRQNQKIKTTWLGNKNSYLSEQFHWLLLVVIYSHIVCYNVEVI